MCTLNHAIKPILCPEPRTCFAVSVCSAHFNEGSFLSPSSPLTGWCTPRFKTRQVKAERSRSSGAEAERGEMAVNRMEV